MQLKFPRVILPLLAIVLLAGVARAGELPKNLRYSFYVNGEPAGHAEVKITRTPTSLVFESDTRVLTGVAVIALESKTVVDPGTYAVSEFSCKGTKGDHTVSCEARVHADSAFGYYEMDGDIRDKHLKMRHPKTLLFEDWLMEHEILFALTQARSEQRTTTYNLLFPTSLAPAEVTLGYSGEVLEEAGPRSMTARKLIVIIAGAEPFESHVNPKNGIPVYMRFPTSHTEAFLDEIFGENPTTYYTTKDKGQ